MPWWNSKELRRLIRRKKSITVEKLCAQGYDSDAAEIIVKVQPFTMTSPERIAALCDAVKYVVANNVPGEVVECGVWRGGSMMAAALMLLKLGACDRTLRLFDTFEGMSSPTEHDVAIDGAMAKDLLAMQSKNDPRSVWCVSRINEVRANLAATGYPAKQMCFLKGKVEDTLPAARLQSLALLRLDTDWYESTRCELEYLYPLLSRGGVLIVDDFGHWQGARRAVEEYFQSRAAPILLHRIDYTGRIGVKGATETKSTSLRAA